MSLLIEERQAEEKLIKSLKDITERLYKTS